MVDRKSLLKSINNPNSGCIRCCRDIEQAIDEFIIWMQEQGYAESTKTMYKKELHRYYTFFLNGEYAWDDLFSLNTVKYFLKNEKNKGSYASAVRGFSKYLFKQNKIKAPVKKTPRLLPAVYEEYLNYFAKIREVKPVGITRIRRVITAYNDYLTQNNIELSSVQIGQIDDFMAVFTKPFCVGTKRVYREYLKGFLNYLYQEGKIKRDYACLVKNPRTFARSKPPKFLRPHELNILFKSLQNADTPRALGTNAMVHLMYYLGLRPEEISKITLDDISFSNGELKIYARKANNPTILPIPDSTLKAIAAYIIGGRPKTESRGLFITLSCPYTSASASSISRYIGDHMRSINLPSTAYWLRHSFAQNMLESGVPLHDISKMMGHECTDSTAKYISINLKLMREVLFDV